MLRFLRKSAPIDIFESISTDDHRALARVSDIVEGKLSYPRQNGLAVALRELGRIERTLFILDWLQRPDGHPKLLHCWPVKLLQAGRGDYAGSEVMIRRAAASLSL